MIWRISKASYTSRKLCCKCSILTKRGQSNGEGVPEDGTERKAVRGTLSRYAHQWSQTVTVHNHRGTVQGGIILEIFTIQLLSLNYCKSHPKQSP